MLMLERHALAREILRCAQDDTKKRAAARVILTLSAAEGEESRRSLRRPALVTHNSPVRDVSQTHDRASGGT